MNDRQRIRPAPLVLERMPSERFQLFSANAHLTQASWHIQLTNNNVKHRAQIISVLSQSMAVKHTSDILLTPQNLCDFVLLWFVDFSIVFAN